MQTHTTICLDSSIELIKPNDNYMERFLTEAHKIINTYKCSLYARLMQEW
jgi:hypothetical protein